MVHVVNICIYGNVKCESKVNIILAVDSVPLHLLLVRWGRACIIPRRRGTTSSDVRRRDSAHKTKAARPQKLIYFHMPYVYIQCEMIMIDRAHKRPIDAVDDISICIYIYVVLNISYMVVFLFCKRESI